MVRLRVRMTKVWKEKMSNPFAGSRRRGSSQERWASMAESVACGYMAAGGNTGSWNSTTRSMVMSPSVHRLMVRYVRHGPIAPSKGNAGRWPACSCVQGERVGATSCQSSGNPLHKFVIRTEPATTDYESVPAGAYVAQVP